MTITWKITLSIDENMLKRTRHAHFQLYILFCDYTAVAFHDSQLKKTPTSSNPGLQAAPLFVLFLKHPV